MNGRRLLGGLAIAVALSALLIFWPSFYSDYCNGPFGGWDPFCWI